MQYTDNLNLKKPESSDFYDVGDQNDNMDALDTAINDLDTGKGDGITYDEANETLKLKSGDTVISSTPFSGGGGAIVNVSTETWSFFGQTVTLTGQYKTYTGTFSAEGTAQFNVKFIGEYEITCGEYTNSVTVEALGAVYSATIDKHYSTINVTTTSSEFIGQTLTLKLGGVTKGSTTFSNGGTASFRVTDTGTFTLYCGEYDKNVVVEALDTTIAVTFNSITVFAMHITGSSESSPTAKVTYPAGSANENFTPAGMNYSTGKFDWGSWGDTWIASCFRPCMLKYDGTVDYYLDPNDYTKKEDGVTASDVANTSYAGNAMIEWGQNGRRIYYKVVPDAGSDVSATVYIADGKLDNDYKDWSFINNQGDEVDHFYTPIYNGSEISSKLRSISGQTPVKSKTATQEMTLAKANNPSTDILWLTEVMCDVILINFLLLLIGKSTDTQTVFGNSNAWGSAESDMRTTGGMNDKGLFYGENTELATNKGVKVFGMEHWWGNQWRRYAGHMNVGTVQKIKLTYGTQDGSTTTGYNEDGSGYISTGVNAGTTSGYILDMFFSSVGYMIPKSQGGSDTTHYPDYIYLTSSGTYYAYRGGSCNGPQRTAGAFLVYLHSAPSHSGWYIGSAPSCKPLA